MADDRVQIVDLDHPHFPEHGVWTGKIIQLFGKEMGEVRLDHCQHGTDACFVSPGQIEREQRRPLPKRKRA
jgi:hypothetical protein